MPSSPHDPRFDAMRSTAFRVREHTIRMAARGGCFLGASLSCVDLLVYLYTNVLRVSRATLTDPDRDYFLLSKGHDVPALYGTLAEIGILDRARLENHLRTTDSIYWHPSRDVPGVEFHSGSLGHLLSVGIGIAMDVKLRSGRNRVFVLTGDGELDEGSMWEACLVANAHRLDELVVVIDRNELQANGPTEEILPLEPLEDKLRAFGFRTVSVDGHSFEALDQAFAVALAEEGKPRAIIARTVRGKGLPSLEARVDRWFVELSPNDAERLIGELHGHGDAALGDVGRVVR